MPQKYRNQHSLKILMFISGKKPLQEYKQDSLSTMYVCILELHLVMSFNSLHTLSWYVFINSFINLNKIIR